MSSSILKFLFPLSGNLLPWILSYRSYFYPLWSYEIHHTSPWESRNIWRQLSWSLWLSPPPPFLFLMWFPTPHSPATISLPGSRVWVRVLDSEWEHFGITWRDFSKETCSLSILCIPRISNTPFGVHKGRSVCTLKTSAFFWGQKQSDLEMWFPDLSIILQLWSEQSEVEETTLLILGIILLLTQPKSKLAYLKVLSQN